MGGDKRSVDRTPRDFLAAWGRGDAGPVPCGTCTACCYYPGVVVDEKRDRKRLAHLLTERSPDGELLLQRRSDGACVHLGERGCTVYEEARGVPHLRLPRLRRDGPSRALWPQSPNAGLGVRRVLGRGRPSPARLNGRRPDLWPFPRHSLRKAKRGRARKFSSVRPQRAECAAAMQETTDCRAAPALLIPLALLISKGSGLTPASRRGRRPQAPNEFPARQRPHQGSARG
jgi:hypothetical protein